MSNPWSIAYHSSCDELAEKAVVHESKTCSWLIFGALTIFSGPKITPEKLKKIAAIINEEQEDA